MRRYITILMIGLLSTVVAQGQIKIGGNVYGGGNQGEVEGNTNVTVRAGDIGSRFTESTTPLTDPSGKVFGGARMANVGGSTYVLIDGESASDDIVINHVYGGNDISGVVGSNDEATKRLPAELTDAAANGVDNTWNSFVHISTKTETSEGNLQAAEGAVKIFIGKLFGGGNGDYGYESVEDQQTGTVTHSIYRLPRTDNDKPIASKVGGSGFNVPDLARSYIDIHGGTISDAYGGGNNATVTDKAVICVNNLSKPVTQITSDGTENGEKLLIEARYREMGIFNGLSKLDSEDFQIGSLFGGNNKAIMAIRPSWNLLDGQIRYLYSGGNRGDMIYRNGLFLEIPRESKVVVDNLFGGCRMADVRPKIWDDGTKEYKDVEDVINDIPGYAFPDHLAARVIVAGGDVNNVYGGNDVRGRVYFGNAIGIQASVRGDIYGGGNGAYAYTDNPLLENDEVYGDFYYKPKSGESTIAALNRIRPNAEQVSIELRGTEDKKTMVKGSIYVGGNCATLLKEDRDLENYPMSEVKFGSYVIAENVFLGNNGAGLVTTDAEEKDNDGNIIKAEGVLRTYKSTDKTSDNSKYNSMDLTVPGQMEEYMSGIALDFHPKLKVEDTDKGDRFDYLPYTSYIGSLYFGSNRGSMTYKDHLEITPTAAINIYNKFVAGCNNANIARSDFNARYEGGILGSAADDEVDNQGNPTYTDGSGNIRDRIVMNLSKIRLKPMRMNSTKTDLEWNTVLKGGYVAVPDGTTLTKGNTYYTSAAGAGQFTALGTEVSNGSNYYSFATTDTYVETGSGSGSGIVKEEDLARRLVGGNVYGGCCESGHVNGNVVINLKGSLVNRHEIFAAFEGEEEGDDILYESPEGGYSIIDGKRNSGVILNEQGMDVLGEALTIFGGGKGKDTEIWGSTTVNITKGYTFQVFGGSESGTIGKGTWVEATETTPGHYDYSGYTVPDERYGTTVNLNGTRMGVSRAEDPSEEMADVEFIYGGGNNGLILGSTHAYLDNGRLFNLFAGSCNADILGHTETYVGLNGFPYLRDHIYGGNDLGGSILGQPDFKHRVRGVSQDDASDFAVIDKVHNPGNKEVPDVLKANAYIEYRKGRMKSIFGGCFGDYDYDGEYTAAKGYSSPKLDNAFVNIRPDNSVDGSIEMVLGGGEGYSGYRDGDKMQNRSYVLVDIPPIPEDQDENLNKYGKMEVFGSGSNNGLGMKYTYAETTADGFDLDKASAIIDLVRGRINAAYGGAYNEGVTRRTLVNVPAHSTIDIQKIFGGAYGTNALPPCDVYESNVNYRSEDAIVRGAIYGGNNNVRRTLYGKVNIFSPVYNGSSNSQTGQRYLGTVYGAGYGEMTWSEYTEVNLEENAKVYEVYGGGQKGLVLNAESVQAYMKMFSGNNPASIAELPDHIEGSFDPNDLGKWNEIWRDAWSLGDYYTPGDDDNNPDNDFDGYVTNSKTNLSNSLARTAEMDDRATKTYKYNTNVIIKEGAVVDGYAYGGGLGETAGTGDVMGSTYIALLGGTVTKDIYAAGTTGNVYDLYGAGFMASANAFVNGGSTRNVYGGGWKGSVGAHTGDISASPTGDKPGETHVVIGSLTGTSFTNGIPTIQRNAYGGGEGGAVFGTTNLTLINGYVGYEYVENAYQEKEEDDTSETPNKLLYDAGCMFGGGYVDNSSVDKTNVNIYGGHVRNSVFGGGEVAAVGRGSTSKTTSGDGTVYTLTGLYRPGKTNVEMFGGHVHRNVFGGGRGYDNLGRVGSLDSNGFVFGQTEVRVHGGEIGTDMGVETEDGNVFGGGDVGYVFSAYENSDGTFGRGVKTGVRYGESKYQGYYYKHRWENDNDVEDQFMHENGDERIFTEDCKVLIEPQCKVIDEATDNEGQGLGVSFTDICYNKGETVATEDLRYLRENNQTSILENIDVLGKVTAEGGIKFSRSYHKGSYVTIAALNTLQNKTSDATRWNCLDPTGIIIHNAVFAGGNTSLGGSGASVNGTSVYGNATASIHDVYNRDLITLGTRHTGGLYGDGNRTFVDGYRELNITNYGTDYYSIKSEISIETYNTLPAREAAYYELKYKCIQDCEDKDGTHYKKASPTSDGKETKASTITADDYFTVFKDWTCNGDEMIVTYTDTDGKVKQKPNPAYWVENGVLPVYAGRLMNSIQRADFCGVWGSRMVMQGAPDRVPEEVDYTNYTINRVREVSLNKKVSNAGDTDAKNKEHGNYFGIYNIVNYLGALTSDVNFGDGTGSGSHPDVGTGDERSTENISDAYDPTYEGQTFYGWKELHKQDRMRNNGASHNKVALASGVYLELTSEKSTGTGLYEKDWGLITGVIELDLINVSPGIGGGFVYAKNVHGVRSESNLVNTTLTALNNNAVTQWDFNYTDPVLQENTQKEFETSGNFVHSSQIIIDDCYNISAKYKGQVKTDGSGAMPAHYWYIKGDVYVYDQYISAYTGIPNAYSKAVEIPLTITAASHGNMKLLNVQPNYYAYYSSGGQVMGDDQKIIINDKTYYKNDPISFWDYYLLSNSEKQLFVDKTYVNCVTCKIDGTEYEAGTYVMSYDDFNTFKNQEDGHTYTDAGGNPILDGDKNVAGTDYIFRESNNVSHDTGYILTYKVNNPSVWDTWYTPKLNTDEDNVDGANKIKAKVYENQTPAIQGKYEDAPTYRLTDDFDGDGIILGQRNYDEGDIISQKAVDSYNAITNKPSSGQAVFDDAYIVTQQVSVTKDGKTYHQNPGSMISKTEATTNAAYSGKAYPAYICTSTIELSQTEFIYVDTKMTEAEKTAYYNRFKDGTDAEKKIAAEILANIVPAYYCTDAGPYGGNYYTKDVNYRGLEAWSSMTKDDRDYVTFNYDALDLLIDPTYTGRESRLVANKYQYDGKGFTTYDEAKSNPAGYSINQPIDYTATYNGEEATISGINLVPGQEINREDYEKLPNEQRNYSAITVKDGEKKTIDGNTSYYVYVVNQPFEIGSSYYSIGSVIDPQVYRGLSDTNNITTLIFPDTDINEIFYYCRESYKVLDVTQWGESVTNYNGTEGYSENGTPVDIKKDEAYTTNEQVPIGLVIDQSTYNKLKNKNKQKDFTIHGISPTETSTLYVSRESDIYDLSKEKIITVVYQYDYEEVQTSGTVTPVSERHVVNIHLQFKSGVPIVPDITKPKIILPGDYISMKAPVPTPGAYEVTGGGWELFEKQGDAESHTNGIDFDPLSKPLYWYQNDWYLAYYAKTYLGRTYSNHVQVSVANYHDLSDVMSEANKAHHMYIDNPGVQRDPKIYLDQAKHEGENQLDLLKNLFDLSVDKPLSDHATLNTDQVGACKNLDFIMRSDLDHGPTTVTTTDPETGDPVTTTVNHPWTPIGDATKPKECFDGTLHGDGYTIRGLDNSLFAHLCGDVYNLGVTGSFTGAGVVDTGDGYVENCWINTTGEPDGTVLAVFGNPNDAQNAKSIQIVNSYYQTGKNYKTTYDESNVDHGMATAKPDQAFYNGEVTYDLNGFYLYKRYNDNAKPDSENEKVNYKYWKSGSETPLVGSYVDNKELCSSGFNGIKYVEDRFDDGDFIYAAGEIPDILYVDERYKPEDIVDSSTGVVLRTEPHYYPIWPDDYLFFGQALNYDQVEGLTHQNTPSTINRSDGRVVTDNSGNRVYRAPAYFRSSEMKMAHFNPYAVFAKTKYGDENTLAYKDMTAIDFTGYNDVPYAYDKGWKQWSKTSQIPQTEEKSADSYAFYPPLLDDDGLTGLRLSDFREWKKVNNGKTEIVNSELTRNLLVYTGEAGTGTEQTLTASQRTANVVSSYLNEPEYSESTEGYRCVDYQNPNIVHGHWVSGRIAKRNHLLVDMEDFNAPIDYKFDSGKRMWYQRQPAQNEFVDRTKGWQGISLPFTAELVTTNQKGEITHFYSGSFKSKNDTETKIGHEYWLRELVNKGTMDLKSGSTDVLVATFSYPTGKSTDDDKEVTNTFLWDYYYEGVSHNQKDANSDTYQEYYRDPRKYFDYPYLTSGKAYLLGLPGQTYYEFDLSGNFEPTTTASSNPEKLSSQTITFASEEETTIQVSDNEMGGEYQRYDGKNYTFRPNYLNSPNVADGHQVFLLNDTGDSYVETNTQASAAVAFRPFFTASVETGGTREVHSIVFSNEQAEMKGAEEHGDPLEGETGTLRIWTKKDKIYVESSLSFTEDMRVVTPAGITVATFSVKPGKTVEVQADFSGMYIVHTLDGKYTKKVAVKRE